MNKFNYNVSINKQFVHHRLNFLTFFAIFNIMFLLDHRSPNYIELISLSNYIDSNICLKIKRFRWLFEVFIVCNYQLHSFKCQCENLK